MFHEKELFLSKPELIFALKMSKNSVNLFSVIYEE